MSLVQLNYCSVYLKHSVNIIIYLPDPKNAETENQEFFQSLWLFPGGFGSEMDFLTRSNIVGYAERHRIAVVMPPELNSFCKDRPGTGSKYKQFMVHELPKIILSYFPISPKREDRIIGGLGSGAADALTIGLETPNAYSCVLMLSGGVPPECAMDNVVFDPDQVETTEERNEINQKYRETVERIKENGLMPPKIYLRSGADDFTLNASIRSRDILLQAGFDLDWEWVPGFGHDWGFWSYAVDNLLDDILPFKNRTSIM